MPTQIRVILKREDLVKLAREQAEQNKVEIPREFSQVLHSPSEDVLIVFQKPEPPPAALQTHPRRKKSK